MRHIDLFSGIGGFALAADKVWDDVEHVFVEIDPFCQEVLKKHWPNSNIYGDIRTITADTDLFGRVHGESKKLSAKGAHKAQRESIPSTDSHIILTGGFPCQPFSQAGRRKGTEDDRHLWPEMLRVIRLTKPEWVIAENVRGILTIDGGMVFEQVCLDLEGEGYEVQPIVIPAVALNAPHRRDRVWFIGHSKYNGFSTPKKLGNYKEKSQTPEKMENGKIYGASRADSDDSDADDSRLQRQRKKGVGYGGQLDRARIDERPDWGKNWLEVATSLCRMDDGVPRRLDRNPRLKALGNAIVPQVAEQIMRAIAK